MMSCVMKKTPFSLKARMANQNVVHVSVKEPPESADDSVVTYFLEPKSL